MLGPNPKKAGTPSTGDSQSSSKTSTKNNNSNINNSINSDTNNGGAGLMVRAIDEIFQHVEQTDDSNTYKVNLY